MMPRALAGLPVPNAAQRRWSRFGRRDGTGCVGLQPAERGVHRARAGQQWFGQQAWERVA